MKRIILLLFILLPFFCSGQTFKIQTGPTFSSLNFNYDYYSLKPYNKTLTGYSVFVGADYLKSTYFFMSSNIGFLTKGGRNEIVYINQGRNYVMSSNAKLSYFSINTGVNFQYPATENINLFVSLLPRVDLLISNNQEADQFKYFTDLRRVIFGIATGMGVQFLIDPFVIGLKLDYYANFNKISSWDSSPLGPGRLGDFTLVSGIILGLKF